MDHSGTLAHTAYGNGFSADFNLHGYFLFYCISGHDRLGSLCSCLQGTVQLRCHCLNAIYNSVNGNLHSDNTCGCNQNTVCRDSKNLSSCICSCLAVAISFRTCTCICNTAVADHSLCCRVIINHILIPFYRSCLHHICSKSTSCHTWNFAVNHSHICTAFVFDFCCCCCCLEAFGSGNTACNYFHNTTPPLPFLGKFIIFISAKTAL